jgi:hypothetical protein
MASSWSAQLIGSGTTGGTASGALVDCPGGRMVFAVVASAFNGATIKLQMLMPDGVTLTDVSTSQTNLTANGAGVVDLPPCQVQATVVGGPPAGVFASIARVLA